MDVTEVEINDIRRRITNDEGHINERLSMFRDLVIEHGCWFLTYVYGHGGGCLSNNEETADVLKERALDRISIGVRDVLRPWEEGKDIEESLNSRFENVLAGKLECERHELESKVGDLVWKALFKDKK